MIDLLNESTLIKNLCSKDLFVYSLINEIENVLNDELNKKVEDINAKIVDDCVEAIEYLYSYLEQSNVATVCYRNVDSIIKSNHKQTRKLIVAAAIVTMLLSINVFIYFLQKNIDIASVKESLAGFIFNSSIIGEILEDENKETENETGTSLVSDSDESMGTMVTIVEESTVSVTETLEECIKGISIDFLDDFKTNYTNIEDIDFSAVRINVYFKNGESKNLSLDDCGLEFGEIQEDGKTPITVSYKDKTATFFVIIQTEDQKNPTTLNSIYGRFSETFDVNDMEVVAVYSDGTEQVVEKELCTIVTEYSNEYDAEIITVIYEECSFSFLSQ